MKWILAEFVVKNGEIVPSTPWTPRVRAGVDIVEDGRVAGWTILLDTEHLIVRQVGHSRGDSLQIWVADE